MCTSPRPGGRRLALHSSSCTPTSTALAATGSTQNRYRPKGRTQPTTANPPAEQSKGKQVPQTGSAGSRQRPAPQELEEEEEMDEMDEDESQMNDEGEDGLDEDEFDDDSDSEDDQPAPQASTSGRSAPAVAASIPAGPVYFEKVGVPQLIHLHSTWRGACLGGIRPLPLTVCFLMMPVYVLKISSTLSQTWN